MTGYWSSLFPESFISPHQREQGKKGPGAGWPCVLVTNLSLWEGFQFFRILSLIVFVTSKTNFASLQATMESSLSILQQSFIMATTLPSTFENGSGNCIKQKKMDRVLFFALPMAWMSIKLAGQFKVPASERKVWSYKIKQRTQFCVSFLDQSEMTQQDMPTKKCVSVHKSCPGEALKVI